MGIMYYNSNNSGGGWWLSEKDWLALEKAGWTVHWFKKDDSLFGFERSVYEYSNFLKPRSRENAIEWLGAFAASCAKEFDSKWEAIQEWESITGQNASDLGCNCCGTPHNFTFWRDEKTPEYIVVEAPTEGFLTGMNE